MYLIAACLPSLRPLLRHIASSSYARSRNAQGTPSSNNKPRGSQGIPYALKAFSRGLSDSGSGSSKEGFTKLGLDSVVNKEGGLEFRDHGGAVVPEGKIGVRSDFRIETNAASGQV